MGIGCLEIFGVGANGFRMGFAAGLGGGRGADADAGAGGGFALTLEKMDVGFFGCFGGGAGGRFFEEDMMVGQAVCG